MAEFALYFANDNPPNTPEICVARTFYAMNDIQATEIALRLFEACNDIIRDYWLWGRHNRLIATNLRKHSHQPTMDLSSINDLHQRYVLELEEMLQTTHDFLARSNKLMQETSRLRNILTSSARR